MLVGHKLTKDMVDECYRALLDGASPAAIVAKMDLVESDETHNKSKASIWLFDIPPDRLTLNGVNSYYDYKGHQYVKAARSLKPMRFNDVLEVIGYDTPYRGSAYLKVRSTKFGFETLIQVGDLFDTGAFTKMVNGHVVGRFDLVKKGSSVFLETIDLV